MILAYVRVCIEIYSVTKQIYPKSTQQIKCIYAHGKY